MAKEIPMETQLVDPGCFSATLGDFMTNQVVERGRIAWHCLAQQAFEKLPNERCRQFICGPCLKEEGVEIDQQLVCKVSVLQRGCSTFFHTSFCSGDVCC